MRKRQRKKLKKYAKALCDCGRIVRQEVRGVTPFLLDLWTECRCGRWLGESDSCGPETNKKMLKLRR